MAAGGESLRDAWEQQAENWAEYAATEKDYTFWRHNLPCFLELIPPAGQLTIDVGCGEGRLGRILNEAGHRVVALDSSRPIAHLAASQPGQSVMIADAAAVPLREAVADLGIAFMSLMDIDDLVGAVHELGRVIAPGGRVCVAIVHPINSAGTFERNVGDSPFTIADSYLSPHRYADEIDRDGVKIKFNGAHWPLEAYSRALEDTGFVIELLREPSVDEAYVAYDPDGARWQRVPLFLHLRAVRTG